METTFDYQRDIAPAIPRFFGEIQSNTKLSDAAKHPRSVRNAHV
jgi:hypothetical protein